MLYVKCYNHVIKVVNIICENIYTKQNKKISCFKTKSSHQLSDVYTNTF